MEQKNSLKEDSSHFIHQSFSLSSILLVWKCKTQHTKNWKVNDNNDKSKCIKSCVAATGFSSATAASFFVARLQNVFNEKTKQKKNFVITRRRRARHYWAPEEGEEGKPSKMPSSMTLRRNLINLILFAFVHRQKHSFNFHHNSLISSCVPPPFYSPRALCRCSEPRTSNPRLIACVVHVVIILLFALYTQTHTRREIAEQLSRLQGQIITFDNYIE